MKKKICQFLFCGIFSIALLLFGATLTSKFLASSATAETEAATVYTLSNSLDDGHSILISKQQGESNLQLGTVANFDEALNLIMSQNPEETNLTVQFNDFVLNETISLSNKNFTFSGSITSTISSPIFEILATSSQNITFKNLTIIASNSQSVIYVYSGEVVNLLLDTTSIETTAADCFAIFGESNNLHITLGLNLSINAEFLTNFNSNAITLTDDFSCNTAYPINISIPFENSSDVAVLNTNLSNYTQFQLVADSSYFTVSQTVNSNDIYFHNLLCVEFDTNGGTFKAGFTPPEKLAYTNYTQTNFPTSTDISKPFHTFNGWFGKLTFSETEASEFGLANTTFYFDQTMLEAFKNSSFDIASLESTFPTSTADLNKAMGFETFAYDETTTNTSTFLSSHLFATLNKPATFVAIFTPNEYSITFNSNGGSLVEPIVAKFGDELTPPTNPTKAGFEFEGWFVDEQLNEAYSFDTSLSENITLYAKWTRLQYTITFVLNNDEPNIEFSGVYNDEIDYPAPQKLGHSVQGWFEDNNTFLIEFNDTLLTESKTVYAKWSINQYQIIFNSNGGSAIPAIVANFGENIEAPTNPSFEGHEFAGWYTDDQTTQPFTFSTMPAQDLTLQARWRVLTYSITFITSAMDHPETQSYLFGQPITLLAPQSRAGFRFGGWFVDETFETQMSQQSMPAQNLTLYALWQEKLTISINDTAQIYELDDAVRDFKNFSTLQGFSVLYKVDGNWVAKAPKDAGNYDVLIRRSEDDNYKYFEVTLSNGLIINPNVLSYTWLIALLFILAFVEISTAILVRFMKKMKSSKTYSFVPITFLLANTVIPTTQIVLLAVSGALALFGFVLLIYELVSLHRTNPNYEFDASTYDNRKHLVKANENDDDEFLTHAMLKSNEKADTYSFSASDIEDMLNDPNYFNKLHSEKNANQKKSNTNTEFETIQQNSPLEDASISSEKNSNDSETSNK